MRDEKKILSQVQGLNLIFLFYSRLQSNKFLGGIPFKIDIKSIQGYQNFLSFFL